MNFDILGVKNCFHLSHKFEGQMAIVENNPVTSLKSIFDLSEGGALHFFSHGSFLSGELLELSGVLIDLRSRISSSGKEVENRLVG
jgi:hypothetical protein